VCRFFYFLIGHVKRINWVYSGMAMFAHVPLMRQLCDIKSQRSIFCIFYSFHITTRFNLLRTVVVWSHGKCTCRWNYILVVFAWYIALFSTNKSDRQDNIFESSIINHWILYILKVKYAHFLWKKSNKKINH
jgi:hypothetical protein